MQSVKYRRVLLKLSGEALMGDSQSMFDKNTLDKIVAQIRQLVDLKVELAIVIGGGNIFRGVNAKTFGLNRTNADYMGMLATIMNGIAFKDFLTSNNISSRIYSAITVGSIIKGYNRDSVIKHLEEGHVVIFVGGTGNPLFTTDSGAALRAIEINADLLIKATKVDGVYDSDPLKNPNAQKYKQISFDEAMSKNLKVMDLSAFELCNTYNINIEVCNIFSNNTLADAVTGNSQGTIVYHNT